jgi:hypothetical protein
MKAVEDIRWAVVVNGASGVINGDGNINMQKLRRDSKPQPSDANRKYRDLMAVTTTDVTAVV